MKAYIGTKGVRFWCPGCEGYHRINTDPTRTDMPYWESNSDKDQITLSPSIVADYGDGKRCHSFVRDGMIQFLGDCTHQLAGQTVPLPELDENGLIPR